MYGNFLTTEINKRLASRLQVQLNNALHLVRNVDISYSLTKLYNELGVDRIETMAKKSACKIVYQAINNKCPDNINKLFNVCEGDRNLCSASSLVVAIPRTSTKFGDRNFAICGEHIWNSIPHDIIHDVSVESFKTRIKQYNGFG